MIEFFRLNQDVLYFISGAAFMAMGITVLIQPRKTSKFEIAQILWLLAGFALAHGCYEWLKMWSLIKGVHPILNLFIFLSIFISFTFLFEFGRKLLWLVCRPQSLEHKKDSLLLLRWWPPVAGVFIFLPSFFVGRFLQSATVGVNYFLSFPGAILSGLGFFMYYAREKHWLQPIGVRKHFLTAGLVLVIYAFIEGLVVGKSQVFPANFLNEENFLLIFKFPIEFLRVICVLTLTWAAEGMLRIFRWETEKRIQDELELEARYEAQKEFTSTVSHEVRTPLASIKTAIDIVAGGNAGGINPNQKDFLEKAKFGIERLIRLINDVLDQSRLEAGQVTLNLERKDLNEIIKTTANAYRASADKKNLYFRVQLDGKLPLVNVDEEQIRQLLENLLGNAIKFTDEGGVIITSSYSPERNNVSVVVQDTGPGIHKEEQDRLFQKFYQLGDASQRPAGGTGLGLSICKEIVRLHHGKIGVDSEPGTGSRFYFILPMVERRGKKDNE